MSSRVPSRTETVQVASFSDGDPNHRPTDPAYVLSNPENYLKKLAAKWMEQRGGRVKPGKWMRAPLCFVLMFAMVHAFHLFCLIWG
jgi:hypothetical protein